MSEIETHVLETGTKPVAFVGLGASAGGLAALQRFFDHSPEDSGAAFIVVMHLSTEHKSQLAEILQLHTAMPVVQVVQDQELEANHVYVIPPGRNLSAIDTHLRLSPLEANRRAGAPIDHFFRTLSEIHGERAVAVVLSGTGSDGAVGLSLVKERGGLAVAQDPAEAEYDSMPQGAIMTGLVDAVLPLREMPAKIITYMTHQPQVHVPDGDAPLPQSESELLQKIFAQLRARVNHDFSGYKRSTVMRRIARRMQLRGVEGLGDYLELLRRSDGEVNALFTDLLISVTNFFRDPAVFELLEREVIPELFEGKGPSDQVRVWAVGCATGEEAYSLAMLLLEHASTLPNPPDIQVFGTDVSAAALERAREGRYPDAIAGGVSDARLERFFVREGSSYRVKKELRERVLFAPHNLLSDPPFSKIDLLTCRNVLIYLQREVQREVLKVFHYALRQDGALLLGISESVETSLFAEVDKQGRLFRRCTVAPTVQLPNLPYSQPSALSTTKTFDETPRDSLGGLHERLLERYAPPSIVIDHAGAIVHLSESAGRYLRQGGGEATHDLLKRIRPELRTELRTVLYAAADTVKEPVRPAETPVGGATARSQPVALSLEGRPRMVSLRATRTPESEGGAALIVFDEYDPPALPDGATPPVTPAPDDRTVRRLEAVLEESERSREEMRASNEEFQSINEELETSKEELQSTNEELITLNQENKHKVEELSQLTSDLQNLFVATDVATLLLDRHGRIKRFTPKVEVLFNILPSDIGQHLTHLTHKLGQGNFVDDARNVFKTLLPVEREIQTDGGVWHLLRLHPYRTAEDRIDGVVLTFVDIDQVKRSEEARRRSEERLRLVIDNTEGYAIFTLDPEGRVVSWNRGAEKVFGYTQAEITGESGRILFTPEDQASGVPERELEEAAVTGSAPDKRWHLRKDGSRFWVDGVTTALRGSDGTLYGFSKIGRDLTEQRRAEEAVRESERRFRALIERSAEAITVSERDGTIRFASPSVETISGYTVEEFTGRDPFAVGDIHPDDLERCRAAFDELLRNPGTSATLRHRYRHASGKWKWLEGTFTGLFDDPAVGGLVANFRDVTERVAAEAALAALNQELERRVAARTAELERRNEQLRRSQQRFIQAFQLGPVAACISTVDGGRFLEVNGAFTELTGYSQAEARGKTHTELGLWASPEDATKLRKAGAAEGGFRNLELHLQTKTGEARVVMLSGEVIELEDQNGFLKMFYDVSERKRTEEQMFQAIHEVMSDTSWFSRKILEQLANLKSGSADTVASVELSRREQQVLERLAKGLSNDAIAADLDLATQTVRNYISAIYDKLGVHSRAEAVIWARERGLVGF